MKDERQKIAVWTHGCRLNRFESDGIISKFISSGRYREPENGEKPDIAIINTCTVTADADRGNRNTIRKIIRENPGAKVIVTGCHAHTNPEDIQKLQGVDFVIGNDRKTSIMEILEKKVFEAQSSDLKTDPPQMIEEDRFSYGDVSPHGHVRSLLKIQDGCNRKCSYCKIPIARGSGVSMPYRNVLDQFSFLRDRGVREVVLTGVNLGWYRDRESDIRFGKLLSLLLDISGDTRIRLSSIEPCDVDAELAELTLHPNFCNYIHVPVQSGSKRILRMMKRTYTPLTFLRRIENVKKINPDIFIGTDIMTGFPGESDLDFQETIALCEDVRFSKIHIFPFSRREGTPAYEFQDLVSRPVMRNRSDILNKLSQTLWREYVLKFRKKILHAIVEKEGKFGNAMTDNYLSLIYDKERFSNLKKGSLLRFEILTPLNDQKVLAKPII